MKFNPRLDTTIKTSLRFFISKRVLIFSIMVLTLIAGSCSEKHKFNGIPIVDNDPKKGRQIDKDTNYIDSNTIYSLGNIKITLENFTSNELDPRIRVTGINSRASVDLYEHNTGCNNEVISSLTADGLFEGIPSSPDSYSERTFFVQVSYKGKKECKALPSTFVHLQKAVLTLNSVNTQIDPRYPNFNVSNLYPGKTVEISVYKDESCSQNKVSQTKTTQLANPTIGTNVSVSGIEAESYYLKQTYKSVSSCSQALLYQYDISVANLKITSEPIVHNKSPKGIKVEHILKGAEVSLYKGNCLGQVQSSLIQDGNLVPKVNSGYEEENLYIKYSYNNTTSCEMISSDYINLSQPTLSLNEPETSVNRKLPVFDVTNLWVGKNVSVSLHEDPSCNSSAKSDVESSDTGSATLGLSAAISDNYSHTYYVKQSYRGISSCSLGINYKYSNIPEDLGLVYDEILYGATPSGIKVSGIGGGGRVSLHKDSCSNSEDSYITSDGTLYPTPSLSYADNDLYLKYVLGSNSECIKLNAKYINMEQASLSLNEELSIDKRKPVFNVSNLFSGKNVELSLYSTVDCSSESLSGIKYTKAASDTIKMSSSVADTSNHSYYIKQSYRGVSSCSSGLNYQYQALVSNLRLTKEAIISGDKPTGIKVENVISGAQVTLLSGSCSGEVEDSIRVDGLLYPEHSESYEEKELYLKYTYNLEEDCADIGSKYIHLAKPTLSLNEELTHTNPARPVFDIINLYPSHSVSLTLHTDPECKSVAVSDEVESSTGSASISVSSDLNSSSAYTYYVKQSYEGTSSCSNGVNYSNSTLLSTLTVSSPDVLYGSSPEGIHVSGIAKGGKVSLHKNNCSSAADATLSVDGTLYPTPKATYTDSLLYLKYTLKSQTECTQLSTRYVNLVKPTVVLDSGAMTLDPRTPSFSVTGLYPSKEVEVTLYTDSDCIGTPASDTLKTSTGSISIPTGSITPDKNAHTYYAKQSYRGVSSCSSGVNYQYNVDISSLKLAHSEYLYGDHPNGISVTNIIPGSKVSIYKGSCSGLEDSSINQDSTLFPRITSLYGKYDLYLKYEFDGGNDCKKISPMYFDLHGGVDLDSEDVTEGETETLTITLPYYNVNPNLLVDVTLTDEESVTTTYSNHAIGGGNYPSVDIEIPTSILLHSRNIKVGACFKYSGEMKCYSNLKTFNINALAPIITINPISDISYGQTATVTGRVTDGLGVALASEPITVIIGSTPYNTTTNAEGNWSVTSGVINVAGSTLVEARVTYDNGASTAVENSSFSVAKLVPEMSLSTSDHEWMVSGSVGISLPNDATGTVDVSVDNGYSVPGIPLAEALPTYNLTLLSGPGTYTVTVKYNGDSKYSARTESIIHNSIPGYELNVSYENDPYNPYIVGDVVTLNITAVNHRDFEQTLTLSSTQHVTLAQSVFEGVDPFDNIETTATYTITEQDIIAGEKVGAITLRMGAYEITEEFTIDNLEEVSPHIEIDLITTSIPANSETYVVGEAISYQATVTNDGNVTVEDVVITDELTGDEWTIDFLSPGASEIFIPESHIVTEQDILSGEVLNVVTARAKVYTTGEDVPVHPGEYPEPTEDKNGSLEVIVETTSTPLNGVYYTLGENVTYQVTVTNNGNLTLYDVTAETADGSEQWDISAALQPGYSEEREGTVEVTEDHILAGKVLIEVTATATSPDPDDPDVSEAGTEEQPAEE